MRHPFVSMTLASLPFSIAAIVVTMAIATPNSAIAQSVWDKMKQQVQQQQAQQKQGQKPAQQQQKNSSQPANSQSNAQNNDTGPFTPPPGTKIDPVVMSPIEQGAQFSVSPHGIHVATLSHSGSRPVVIYDGVVGPKFDQVFLQDGAHPVVFSPDGNHWAYCAATGTQWVVMVDGKQLTQSSETINGAIQPSSCMLGFTSNSKHVFYTSMVSVDASHTSERFVFDGKATPLGADGDLRNYAFSPDGNHVAYFVGNPDPRTTEQPKLWIDGKPAPYAAGSPQWSADSQHLFTKRTVPVPGGHPGSATEVLYDGKPIMRVDDVRLYIPPVGNMMVAAVRRLGTNPPTDLLVVGGKPVPGSEVVGGQIANVVFSPDGKHYAAHYANANRRHYVFSDGKKGLEYPGISDLTIQGKSLGFAVFTADSSTLIYSSYDTLNSQHYLILNGEESDQLFAADQTIIAPAGNHVLTAGFGQVTLNGKVQHYPNVDPHSTQALALSFSPDASHYAFVMHERAGPVLFLDGVPQTAYSPINGGQVVSDINISPYIWSPDSKHIAYLCRSSNPAANNDIWVCLDDKAAHLGPSSTYSSLIFTSDSNHLLWVKTGPNSTFRVFADGKPVAEGFRVSTAGLAKETWQSNDDGSTSVLMEDDTSLKRVTITPSSSTSIATLFAGGGLSAQR
jgi:hypothetical protein